jgi:hypothetical protein
MIDPELEKYLVTINNTAKQLKVSPMRALLNGVMSGVGYVIGFALTIILIGYALNVIGIIPAFKGQVDEWKGLLQRTQEKVVVPVQNTR